MIISKEFGFDAGHRLSKGYDGKCANPHGHRYTVRVELTGPMNGVGMVRDFNELKEFKQLVDETFDHKFLMYRGDEHAEAMIELWGDDAVVELDDNPTAEFLAKTLLAMTQEFDWGELVSAVTVWETPTSFARVEGVVHPAQYSQPQDWRI